MGGAEIRLGFDGGAVMANRFLNPARAFQHGSQVAMGFRVLRTALQSFAERRLGLAESLLTHEKDPVVVVALGKVRIDFERSPILPICLGRLALAGVESDQVGMRLGEPGVLPYRLFVFGD